jgi:hypothetical protein
MTVRLGFAGIVAVGAAAAVGALVGASVAVGGTAVAVMVGRRVAVGAMVIPVGRGVKVGLRVRASGGVAVGGWLTNDVQPLATTSKIITGAKIQERNCMRLLPPLPDISGSDRLRRRVGKSTAFTCVDVAQRARKYAMYTT